MKRITKLLACIFTVAVACCTLFACGGGGLFGGATEISFWVEGNQEELTLYKKMTDEFNATYGKDHSIHVNMSQKPVAGYESQVQLYASSKSGPDVFITWEDVFKKWVNAEYLTDLSDYISEVKDIDISDIYDTVVDRLRYNVETNTSNPDDPLYGLPLDTKPTAIYYNESFFESMGIITIGVDEDKMDKWNNNEIADNRGKYKRDFTKLNGITVPKKGYYRSESPYAVGGYKEWSVPTKTEVQVFNNRIAMNWDELEDLARQFTPSYNPAAKNLELDYGFFSEWWFNYGWSVGGDCLTDLSGSGKWNFSLLDYTDNYIVAEGKTYVGEYSGKTYNAGETLSLSDKLSVGAGKYLVADEIGGYHEKDSYTTALSDNEKDGEGAIDIRPSIVNEAKNGTLVKLPSTREAFLRYLKLGAATNSNLEGEGGLNISPNPMVFSNRTRSNYFYSGKMAMLVEYSSYMSAISENMADNNWKWDIAPLAVYKKYSKPEDPSCDTVVARGKVAGQSNSRAMCSRENSTKKTEAAAFICWMASRNGQQIAADNGFFTNQLDLVDDIKFQGYAPSNVKVFGEAMSFQGPGDWWYMKDYEWINIWAIPLNSKVRNGLQTYSSWKNDAIPQTNDRLLSY